MITEEDIVRIARETVEEHVYNNEIKEIKEEISESLQKRAGVFVTIKKNGDLRGCIGTVKPTQNNIIYEVIKNAVSAAAHDPRFPAITSEELDKLSYSVDVLGEKEKVDELEDLNPKEYGVIVKRGPQTGLLLPNLEGIDRAEEQVEIARKKAGIPAGSDFELYRFRVIRYSE